MTEHEALGIVRNPWGHREDAVREARILVCDRLETWREAYENMREFAIASGLDVTSYVGPENDK